MRPDRRARGTELEPVRGTGTGERHNHMQQALTLRLPRPLPGARFLATLLIAALVASGISIAYMAQARAEGQLEGAVVHARAAAVEARGATLRAGVPEASLAEEDRELAALAANVGPGRLPFLDREWRAWASRAATAYRALEASYAVERTAYAEALTGRLGASLSSVDGLLADWTAAGGTAEETQPLRDRVAALLPHVLNFDIRSAAKDVQQADALLQAARVGLAQQAQDNADAATYAQEELATATANLGAEQKRAAQVAYDAAGDAEAAAHFSVPGSGALAARVSSHAAATSTSDPTSLASAVAWLRVDEGRLAAAMQAAMPARAIYISLGRQELRAYDHGRLAQETLVTTGRPELPTVTGSMKVLWKSSPWTMHSPFPTWSRFWYPDTRVQMVLWFHEGGYGIHDAYWRHLYGPGTNVDGSVPGTHGCVNVPWTPMVWLFNWAQVGTPVTVG